MRLGRAAAALATALAFPAVASAATYTVPASNNGDPSGASCNSARVCGSLRAAVAAADAHPGSTIQLAAATYGIGHAGSDAPGTGDLKLTAAMTIVGKGAGAAAGTTIAQTDMVSRVVTITGAGAVTLKQLEITGGHPSMPPGGNASGGGIDTASGSTLTLDHVLVTQNAAQGADGMSGGTGQDGGAGTGGGIASMGALTLIGSSVTHNVAIGGSGGAGSGNGFGGGAGGGGIEADGSLTLTASDVSDNQATSGPSVTGFSGTFARGGGIDALATLTVGSGSKIDGNSVTGGSGVTGGGAYAGGVEAGGPSSTLTGVQIRDNMATSGAGGGTFCFVIGGGLRAANSTTVGQGTDISSNTARAGASGSFPATNGCTAQGGGIAGTDVHLAIGGASITANQAIGGTGGGGGIGAGGNGGPAQGGGVFFDGQSTVTVTNTLLAKNQATAGGGGGGGTGGGAGADAYGGAIEAYASTLALTGSELEFNTATGGSGGNGSSGGSSGSAHGGGVVIAGNVDTTTIDSSTLFHNAADGGVPPFPGTSAPGRADGGGLSDITATSADAAVVRNSTIAGNMVRGGTNTANNSGGGVSSFNGPVSLQSDTVADNSAGAAGTGGNLWAGGIVSLLDTMITGGSAGSGQGNCIVTGSINDAGYNLEDSGAATSQCGLSAGLHDVLVAPGAAGLWALAANPSPIGHLGLTLALQTTSPAIGAGGGCVALSPKLDERGDPRHVGCDIGAFEHELPTPVTNPQIKLSHTSAFCVHGNWTGAGTVNPSDILHFTYQWLRNGIVVPGATAQTYKVTKADRGRMLQCRVRATGYYGASLAGATSTPVKIPKVGVASVHKQTAAVHRGKVPIVVSCSRAGPCTGVLQILAADHSVIGHAQFVLGAGATHKVSVRLTKHGLALLKAARHGLNVTLVIGRSRAAAKLKRAS